MPWSSGLPPGSVISSEDSQDSGYRIRTAVTYYSERMQSKISEGESAWGKDLAKPGVGF